MVSLGSAALTVSALTGSRPALAGFVQMLLAMRQDRHKSTLLTDLCHRALLLL